MVAQLTLAQRAICARYSAEPHARPPDAKLGLGPMQGQPINGLRHRHGPGTSGWFIWAGVEIDQSDDSFFAPLHMSHLESRYPDPMPYLALPPGWRFQIAPGYEDVWYDPSLLALK